MLGVMSGRLVLHIEQFPERKGVGPWSRRWFFHQVLIEGASEAFPALAEAVKEAMRSQAATIELTVDGGSGTLVVALGREGLELVILHSGLVIAGDAAELSALRSGVEALASGHTRAWEGEVHDWHGTDEGPIARLSLIAANDG